jgi:hypothetical protein
MLTGNKPKKVIETNGDADDTKGLNLKKRRASKVMDKEKQTDRTTRMLLAVLALFLLTEFPQGILGLLNAIYGWAFYKNCYSKLGGFLSSLFILILIDLFFWYMWDYMSTFFILLKH